MTVGVASSDPLVHVMSYGPAEYEEATPARLLDARGFRGRRAVTWLNVNTARDAEMIDSLERDFGVHPLTVEDIRNTRQRPKVEVYRGYVYVVAQMLARGEDGTVTTEQMSLILGADWLITVQEKPGDIFGPVRDRIRNGGERIRSGGADYLAYALVDAIVDSYFPILEAMGRDAEAIEDGLLEESTSELRERLQDLRRELLKLHRVAWPQRDALAALARDDTPFFRPETRTYLRDVIDHATRVIDFVETSREMAANLMDLYLAGVAQRTNETTKVLTMVATVFIPLTFIVGVYGMNFDTGASRWNMPELLNPYGYPAVLLAMAVLTAGMLVYFRRKGWI